MKRKDCLEVSANAVPNSEIKVPPDEGPLFGLTLIVLIGAKNVAALAIALILVNYLFSTLSDIFFGRSYLWLFLCPKFPPPHDQAFPNSLNINNKYTIYCKCIVMPAFNLNKIGYLIA